MDAPTSCGNYKMNECDDVIDSNTLFAVCFFLVACTHICILPFQTTTVTTALMVRFDIHLLSLLRSPRLDRAGNAQSGSSRSLSTCTSFFRVFTSCRRQKVSPVCVLVVARFGPARLLVATPLARQHLKLRLPACSHRSLSAGPEACVWANKHTRPLIHADLLDSSLFISGPDVCVCSCVCGVCQAQCVGRFSLLSGSQTSEKFFYVITVGIHLALIAATLPFQASKWSWGLVLGDFAVMVLGYVSLYGTLDAGRSFMALY